MPDSIRHPGGLERTGFPDPSKLIIGRGMTTFIKTVAYGQILNRKGDKMEEKCLCEPNEVIIFSCAGSSNVGQLANQASVKLAQKGVGRFFCLG
jgi:hypothetical protein